MTDLDRRLRNAGGILDDAAERARSNAGTQRRRYPHRRLVAVATGAVAAVLAVVAVAVLVPERDGAVVAGQDPASTSTPEDVAIETAVPRIFPGYTFTERLEGEGPHATTDFEFVHDSGSSLKITIYTTFSVDEMTGLTTLATDTPRKTAWLGADDPDLRSVYLISDFVDGGIWMASSTSDGGQLLEVQELVRAAEQLVQLPAFVTVVQGDAAPIVAPSDQESLIDDIARYIPLPEGGNFDNLKGNAEFSQTAEGLAGSMAFVAVCQWAVYWQDGNPEQRAEAVEVLQQAPSWPQFKPTAGQSLLDFLRQLADAAASGDSATVAQFTTANDCG